LVSKKAPERPPGLFYVWLMNQTSSDILLQSIFTSVDHAPLGSERAAFTGTLTFMMMMVLVLVAGHFTTGAADGKRYRGERNGVSAFLSPGKKPVPGPKPLRG
jgi:hypothetical protein